jgi:hypothetical protein
MMRYPNCCHGNFERVRLWEDYKTKSLQIDPWGYKVSPKVKFCGASNQLLASLLTSESRVTSFLNQAQDWI